jgi:hypothetical protein
MHITLLAKTPAPWSSGLLKTQLEHPLQSCKSTTTLPTLFSKSRTEFSRPSFELIELLTTGFCSRSVRSHPRFAGTVLGHGLLHKQFLNGAHITLL